MDDDYEPAYGVSYQCNWGAGFGALVGFQDDGSGYGQSEYEPNSEHYESPYSVRLAERIAMDTGVAYYFLEDDDDRDIDEYDGEGDSDWDDPD